MSSFSFTSKPIQSVPSPISYLYDATTRRFVAPERGISREGESLVTLLEYEQPAPSELYRLRSTCVRINRALEAATGDGT